MSIPTPSIDEAGRAAIDKFLADTAGGRRVPATFLGVTTAKGELYFNQDGERVFGEPDKGVVDDQTVLQLFSTTKLVTAIACHQLVDQGKISLHDPDVIAKYCPELGELDILEGYDAEGKEILSKPRNRITLNMLLTHTSGLSYGFNSPLTERWIKEHNVPSMLSPNAPLSAYLFPLLFEPGTHFRYSVGIDWAGFLVSRVTGLSLEDYFQKHIFQPSGIEHMSFHPPKDYAERRMGMLVRPKPDGALLHTGEQPLPRTFVAAEIGPHYSGGGGLFGTARDYLRFLRAILASADPNTANPLISTASFRTLFTDTLPQDHRETMREELVVMAKGQNIHDPALLASGKGENIGHSPGLFLNYVESKFGRSAMSGCWDGAAKTMYWLDPAKGIAAVCFTNLLAPNPDPWNKVYNDFERLVYDHLV